MKINFLAALPFLMVAAIPLALSPANAATNAAARAKSSPPEIQAGLDGGGSGFLSLNWNEPVVTRSEWANQELTLRFSRPLADAPIAEAGSRLADAVETIRYGYDSVLLRLSPGFEPRVETTGTGVVVTLRPVRRGAWPPGRSVPARFHPGQGAAGIRGGRFGPGRVAAFRRRCAGFSGYRACRQGGADRRQQRQHVAQLFGIRPNAARRSRQSRPARPLRDCTDRQRKTEAGPQCPRLLMKPGFTKPAS